MLVVYLALNTGKEACSVNGPVCVGIQQAMCVFVLNAHASTGVDTTDSAVLFPWLSRAAGADCMRSQGQ